MTNPANLPLQLFPFTRREIKNSLASVITLFVCLVLITSVSAQTNYTCNNAVPIVSGSNYVIDTTSVPSNPNTPLGCGANIRSGLWYTLTSPIQQRLVINTCGSTFPTDLAVYTGDCSSLQPIQCVSEGNNLGCGNPSPYGEAGVSFSVTTNTTYYIFTGGHYTQTVQSGQLHLVATLMPPPNNDTWVGATQLTPNSPFVEDTTPATEFGDSISSADCSAQIVNGVWFYVTVTNDQSVIINTCDTQFPTIMAVYSGTSDAPVPVACASEENSFNCGVPYPYGQAGVSFNGISNTTYHILVGGSASKTIQSGMLHIISNIPPPTNDLCSGAIAMTPGVVYTNNTTYATETGDPVPDCTTIKGGIWYTYQPLMSGPVGITTCGSDFSTALAVYAGSCGGTFTPVTCSNSPGSLCANRASVNFNGIAGTNYYILAGGYGGASGNLQILVPIVDLVSTNLIASSTANVGQNFIASWTIQNSGTTTVNGTWADTLSLSNATTNVVLLNGNGFHTAPAGGSYVEIYSVTLPPIPAGTYTLIAQADAGNVLAETNENNNTQTLSVIVTNIPPYNPILLTPAGGTTVTSCVPVTFQFTSQVQPGSYPIASIRYFNQGIPALGQSTSPPYGATVTLSQGTNFVTAQAVDTYGQWSTSQVATITVAWPGNFVMQANEDTNGNCVVCMGAQTGSNYVVYANTNLLFSNNWHPYLTNPVVNKPIGGPILIFTNAVTNQQNYFRVQSPH